VLTGNDKHGGLRAQRLNGFDVRDPRPRLLVADQVLLLKPQQLVLCCLLWKQTRKETPRK